MDRLGPTLATWADAMRYKQTNAACREQVSAVGRKLLRLLQGLHEKGDIHGDVKPENFLAPYRPANDATGTAVSAIDMRKDDPVMVDLGFSSSWRKKTGEHIDYSQALGQFHGTTRYASLHCHAGRTLARRDDLESLAYTVLYLLQGRLPWQGQEGADKEQRDQKVLRIKGSMTPSAICATAPLPVRRAGRKGAAGAVCACGVVVCACVFPCVLLSGLVYASRGCGACAECAPGLLDGWRGVGPCRAAAMLDRLGGHADTSGAWTAMLSYSGGLCMAAWLRGAGQASIERPALCCPLLRGQRGVEGMAADGWQRTDGSGGHVDPQADRRARQCD
jgi:hypothetical protein